MVDPFLEVDEPVPEEPFDASNLQQVNDRKRDAGRRRKEARVVVANLLSHPQGRNWMWDLLEGAHMFRPSFIPGDPHASAFAEGERNIGLKLLADIMIAAPDAFTLMLKENNKRG